MFCPSRRTHLEDNVLQTSRLSRWPVNTRSRACSRDIRQVKDEVPNLPVEDICRPPVQISRVVFVAIDKTEAGESSCRLQSWRIVWIADELGIVLIDDRGGDEVCAGREVDHCWSGGAGCTSLTTSASGIDGSIDGGGIIGDAVSYTSFSQTGH